MHDMKAMRVLADSVIGAADYLDPDDILSDAKMAARSICQDCRPLAAFVRDITDETPLTVESLVRECSVDTQTFGHRTLFFRGFHVRLAEKWEWFFSSMEPIPDELQPRTVGDLRRLQYQLERDGGKSWTTC